MMEGLIKSILIGSLLLCFYTADGLLVNASETSGDVLQDSAKVDRDFPDLRGGSERSERERQQAVDMRVLQQSIQIYSFYKVPRIKIRLL